MEAKWSFLLILLFSLTELTTAQQDVCPPWFVPDNRSRTGCSCHSSDGTEVKCGSDFPLLHFGLCMTYNKSTETTEYGPCPYIAHYNTTAIDYMNVFYIQLPSNSSLLNQFMCGPLNREGELCGKCKDGYGTALYSYTLECRKCWGHGYGWVLYWALELFPITVMYFLVVIFNIRASSSPLGALVFMSHFVVYTIRLNVPLHMYIENEITGFSYVALKVLLVLCGIWSLDFFRSVIPPFCVSSNMKTVHALALEYVVAFYPIFLIFLTYICIKLHDNNFRPVVCLWKPFHRHFAHFRRRWDSKASIVNAFTTFLVLSFSKILFVSFTLLYPFYIHYNYDNIPTKFVLYYDPTVEYHTLEYFIFAAIAGCVLAIFIISPAILLILYPTRLFRKCVSCCGFRRWHALHMFIESFQGQYKDGTNGTRDFRMVSASFLILRILILATFLYHRLGFLARGLQCLLLVCAMCFYAVVRPYKQNYFNTVDFLILALLEVLSFELLSAAFHTPITMFTYYGLVTILMLGFPHMILIFYICHVLAKKAGITQCAKRRYITLKRACVLATRHTSEAEADVEAESDIDSLPDRLINPGEYEPLLPTTEEHTAAELTEDKLGTANEDPRRLTPVYTYGSIV